MPGKIDAVWNLSEDPKRPWPERRPELRVFPNPLYLGAVSQAAFAPFYFMGKVKVRIEAEASIETGTQHHQAHRLYGRRM